jgi:hypothetical protein
MLKFFKDNWLAIGFCSVVLLVAYYYVNIKREGFQTPSPDKPASCAMMNIILESAEKQLKEAKVRGLESETKGMQLSYDAILAEKEKMAC